MIKIFAEKLKNMPSLLAGLYEDEELREQIKGAGEDYNTMTKFMDLANVSLVVE